MDTDSHAKDEATERAESTKPLAECNENPPASTVPPSPVPESSALAADGKYYANFPYSPIFRMSESMIKRLSIYYQVKWSGMIVIVLSLVLR